MLELRDKLKLNFLKGRKVTITAFGGQEISNEGIVDLVLETRLRKISTKAVVVDYEGDPLLGFEDCQSLHLKMPIPVLEVMNSLKNTFINQNIDVFEGLGKFPDKIKLHVKSNAVPQAHPPRRVNIKIKDRLKGTLDEYERKGIIVKSNEPMEWVNHLVVVEKANKTLRICIDPKHLNNFLLRDYYEIPSLEQVRQKIAHHKFYSVFDLRDGYFHIVLDEESTKYCGFSTPFGVYKFLRMPQGVSPAPEIFQRLVSSYFEDIEGVTVYFDDVIVYADTKDQHDKIIDKVVQRARKLNIKFNADKLQFCVNQAKYLGLLFDKDGVRIDEDRIRSIKELKQPNNIKELQSFLGMLNYLRSFIPNLAELTTSMRLLLRKNVIFEWNATCQNSVSKIKKYINSITSPVCIRSFKASCNAM